MSCTPKMTRLEAEDRVQEAYVRFLGRDPFASPYDAAAYDWVIGLMYDEALTVEVMAEALSASQEAHERAEEIVRGVYRELLRRDPGPTEPGGEWVDPSALDWVRDVRTGVKTEASIREEISASEEFQEKHRHDEARPVKVKDFVLFEPTGEKASLELGISLFYAMSPDVTRDDFRFVADELAEVGIEQARLAQTFTWDNPPRMRNVVPFKPGNTYVHDGGVDAGRAVDPVADPEHFEELGVRLDELRDRGIRAQYTIFWGGMQPLFTRGADGRPGHPPGHGGHDVIWGRVEPYLESVAKFFDEHPEHTLEIINECDHFHHLGPLGFDGRKEFLSKCARIIRRHHPEAVLTASDGGHEPREDGMNTRPAEEGSPYFDYHGVEELDYWNVHYPRNDLAARGIPRWCRGSWHLYQDKGPFRQRHAGKGYGRSDENIFLTTPREFDTWGYRGSTRDWRMYGTMLWVTTMAGAGVTLHTFKGFFCERGLTRDPVFRVVTAFRDITEGFPWHGATHFNTAWHDSPITDFEGPFKAFALVGGQNRSHILITVLNPEQGKLDLKLNRSYDVSAHEITGETRLTTVLDGGEPTLTLPATNYKHGLVVRMVAR